jgi:cytochrome bd-type quinol oxidase subunit 2
MLRPVYHGEHGLRTLRELGRSYQTLSQDLNRVMNRIKALYLPAVLALCGWIAVFVTPALQPHGWQFMAYALGTIVLGFAAYLILARRKREWPFLPSGTIPPGADPAFE